MTGLPDTIETAGALLRTRAISSVELTSAYIARAQAAQPSLGAFVTITAESALGAAREADADFSRGVDRGPLQGIPLAIKDIIATRDAPSTANSRVLDPAWGNRDDATTTRKLRAAGAVILGKLVLHEFATGWPDPATGFPIARNPWDPSRTPGGSSSGTGVAVAAGLALGGLGTDTSGSIRGPAAYCGIAGLKPTFGRVSKEGCVPLAYSLDNIGPMARTARDCALLLQAIAGYDPLDPCTVDAPVPEYVAGLNGRLTGLKVGVPRDYFFTVDDLDAAVRDAVLTATETLRQGGAEVHEVAIPHAAAGNAATTVTNRSESYAYHEHDLRTRPGLYGKYTRQVLQIGAFFTGADFVQAQRVRSLAKAECAVALRDVDVLVVPTMLGPAATFAGYDPDGRVGARPSFTGYWNLVGLPSLAIGCAFTAGGLPIGMQIVGRPYDEATVLRVGDAYQRLTDWHLRRPAPPSEIAPLTETARLPPPSSSATPVAAVDQVIELAGLDPDDEDRARLYRIYADLREVAGQLRIAGLSAEEPALTYRAS